MARSANDWRWITVERKRNGGERGVDGTTVDELMAYSQKHWAQTREELLHEKHAPQPVRKVDMRSVITPTKRQQSKDRDLLLCMAPQAWNACGRGFRQCLQTWRFGHQQTSGK